MESIYWVVSRDCNQRCPHCYNDSAPGAPGLTAEEINRAIAHLPERGEVPIDRIILSGGENLCPRGARVPPLSPWGTGISTK